jgi:two-component system nitrate/nitrite response regulator NarL
MPETINVVIVGGSDLVRDGLRYILEKADFYVEVSAVSVAAMTGVEGQAPDPRLVLIDGPAVDDQLETCRQVRELFPRAKLALMSDKCDLESVARGVEHGVDGYLNKETSSDTLLRALGLVLAGEKFVCAPAFSQLATLHETSDGRVWDAGSVAGDLSDREVDILECLAVGDSNKLIARKLAITEATVKVHNKAILRKLHLMNRTQAAIWAINRGLTGSRGQHV